MEKRKQKSSIQRKTAGFKRIFEMILPDINVTSKDKTQNKKKKSLTFLPFGFKKFMLLL